MQYWLLKTEPETFSWEDLTREKQAHWDGVRNYQARNNLMAMQAGDLAFIYYSGKEKGVIGVAEILSAHYPDPTSDDERWVAVAVGGKAKLKHFVELSEIKANPDLSGMVLLRNSRLSVQPVQADEWEKVLKMGGGLNV
jgi:predicted RNA-binding protein with PUA-like domain